MELNSADFTTLMAWLGPKALAAHKKYPRGLRQFNTETRVFRYNIAPDDYFHIAPGVAGVSPPMVDGIIQAAYLAMRDVIRTLEFRGIKFRIICISWANGGSYIEASFPPKPATPSGPEICSDCREKKDYGQEETCLCDLL